MENVELRLPASISMAEFESTFRMDPSLWKEAAQFICTKEGFAIHSFKPFVDGANLVASIDEHYVIKIFPPFLRHQWDSDCRSLEFLGSLSVPIPILKAKGAINEWTYMIMTRVDGLPLEQRWNVLPFEHKKKLLQKTGELMKEVHLRPLNGFSLPPEWHIFIQQQASGFLERHRKRGMPEWFLKESEKFVREHLSKLPVKSTHVLLTGEYTPFNLLVDNTNNISGMIDFGDAMTGFHEYDLLGPIMFLVSGDKQLFHALLNGYGYTQRDINEDLQKRLMLLQILHRYSDFNSQLRIPGWQEKVHSLDELMELIFPMAAAA